MAESQSLLSWPSDQYCSWSAIVVPIKFVCISSEVPKDTASKIIFIVLENLQLFFVSNSPTFTLYTGISSNAPKSCDLTIPRIAGLDLSDWDLMIRTKQNIWFSSVCCLFCSKSLVWDSAGLNWGASSDFPPNLDTIKTVGRKPSWIVHPRNQNTWNHLKWSLWISTYLYGLLVEETMKVETTTSLATILPPLQPRQLLDQYESQHPSMKD